MKLKLSTLLYFLLFLLITPFASEPTIEIDLDQDSEVIPSALIKVAEEAFDLNTKGLDALNLENYDEALTFFKKAAQTLPNYSDAINNCGVVYFRRGNISLAEETWQKVIEIDPEYAIVYYNLGILSFNKKETTLAKTYFRQALDKNDRFVDALVMLGKINLSQGYEKEAIRILKKAYGINRAHQGSWGTYAFALIKSGDTLSAEKILKRESKNHHALKMLGEIEATRGADGQALSYLQEAISRGGDKAIYLTIAEIHLAKGNKNRAFETMKTFFKQVSYPSADAWLLGGIIAKECDDLQTARTYFDKGLSYYPKDEILRYNAGLLHFYHNEYQKAKKIWDALSDTINDPALYHLKAVVAHKLKENELAESLIQRALLLDAKAAYHDFLGVLLFEKGKKERAIRQFKKALSKNPALYSAQLNLALAEKDDKNLVEAIEKTERELRLCKSDCKGIALRLAILYYYRRDFARAISLMQTIDQEKRDLTIYKHLALFYTAQGSWDKALSTLEEARTLFTLDPQTEYTLAETYLHTGLYSKGIAILTKLIPKWTGNSWRLYYQLGYAQVKQNALEQAQTALEKSLQLNKKSIATRGLLAFVFNSRGLSKKAQNLWAQTLKEDPQNPTIWINMGLVLEQEGNYQKALEKYEKALSLDPKNLSIHINVGNVYESKGELNRALKSYERALGSPKRNVALYNAFNVAIRDKKYRKAEKFHILLQKEFSQSINTKRASGEMLLIKGDTLAAEKSFESLSQKNHNDWFALATIYVHYGKHNLAKRAIVHIPDTPVWEKIKKRLTAKQAFAEKEYDQAYSLYSTLKDTSFSGLYNQALAAFNAQHYGPINEMENNLLDKAQSTANQKPLYRLLGNTAIKQQDWLKARRWFTRLTEIEQENGLAWYNRAVAEYNLDKIDLSWEYYQKARALNPSYSNQDIEKKYQATQVKPKKKIEFTQLEKMYNEAVEHQAQGNEKAAESLYRKIVQEDDRFYRAWNNLGAIYGAQGEIELAIDCYKNAVSKRADIADGYANLVNIYLALEKYSKAEKWLTRGKKHNPDNTLLEQLEKQLKSAKKSAQ